MANPKNTRVLNNEIIARLRWHVEKALADESYTRDYEFLVKRNTLSPAEKKAAIRKFEQKHYFLLENPATLKIVKKSGDKCNWEYEKMRGWLSWLTYSYFGPPVILEHQRLELAADGKLKYLPEIGDDGYVAFFINPNNPRKLIRQALDNILDRMEVCGPAEPRFSIEKKLGALEVWKARRMRKSFSQIGEDFGITEDAAKKRFYVAFKYIYGKPYNPAKYIKPKIKKENLKRECSTCKERPTCEITGVLCPDVLAYVNQDTRNSLRERQLL